MPPALNALVMMVASVSLFYDVTVSLFTRKLRLKVEKFKTTYYPRK